MMPLHVVSDGAGCRVAENYRERKPRSRIVRIPQGVPDRLMTYPIATWCLDESSVRGGGGENWKNVRAYPLSGMRE